jgi:hypothetical protein
MIKGDLLDCFTQLKALSSPNGHLNLGGPENPPRSCSVQEAGGLRTKLTNDRVLIPG